MDRHERKNENQCLKRKRSKKWYIMNKEPGIKLFMAANEKPVSSKRNEEFGFVKRLSCGDDDDLVIVSTIFISIYLFFSFLFLSFFFNVKLPLLTYSVRRPFSLGRPRLVFIMLGACQI